MLLQQEHKNLAFMSRFPLHFFHTLSLSLATLLFLLFVLSLNFFSKEAWALLSQYASANSLK